LLSSNVTSPPPAVAPVAQNQTNSITPKPPVIPPMPMAKARPPQNNFASLFPFDATGNAIQQRQGNNAGIMGLI
jgi:hypothetical protein